MWGGKMLKTSKKIVMVAMILLLLTTVGKSVNVKAKETTQKQETTTTTSTEAQIGKVSKPKDTKIRKYEARKNSIRIAWKTRKKVTGYQIQYSTNKKFKKKHTELITIKGKYKSSKRLKELQPDTKYYIRVRTYKITKDTKYYSDWSKPKKIKTNITNNKWGSRFGFSGIVSDEW